jgi:hypothetical protein
MPNRQEVLEALRNLCEEVMESLRILFFMLFTMTKAVEPETQMQESEMLPINQLVSEVRSQKVKIQELGNLITNQFTKDKSAAIGPQTMSPNPTLMMGFEQWELAEMEVAEADQMFSGICPGNGVGPSSFQPTSPPKRVPTLQMPAAAAAANPKTKIAGIPLSGSTTHRSQGSAGHHGPPETQNPQGQVALTQAALEAWGNKTITWGKKHPGKTYVSTYDSDPGYTKWILSRISNLGEDMEDYANYAMTRRHLEEAALKHVSG